METMMALGVAGVLLGVLASLTMYSGKNFLAILNYSDLNSKNRIAMDTMTRDVRECSRVRSYTSSRLEIEDSDGSTIVYAYSSGAETLIRTQNGVSRTLATGCDRLIFSLGTRVPKSGAESFTVETTGDVNMAKVVYVTWNCSRTIMGTKVNTESVQTARIVIRKQRLTT